MHHMAEKTILIVDDDQDIRQVIRMRLERLSYRILEASDGQEALRMMHACVPDVMFLDWRMPGGQGKQLLEALQADPVLKNVHVIVVTGDDQAVKEAMQFGAFSSLIKPFGPKDLLDKLAAALA